MKNVSKHMEVSCQSLGAAMFMAIVCIYMIIGAITVWAGNGAFYYHIQFTLLIQGVIISMSASIIWTLFLGMSSIKSLFAKIFLCSMIIMILLGISVLIPAINKSDGYIFWILSCIISLFGFGILLALYSERYYKKTGVRSVLVWEIQ